MRPKPFKVIIHNNDERYIKDLSTGLVWHRCSNRTLYADTDRSAVVYHSNYLRYFELGRGNLMRDADYPYSEIEKSGYVYPIIEIGVKYYSPLHYDDLMLIHTRPDRIERVKLQFEYIITNSETGNIVCTGFTQHCALNNSGRPVAIDQQTVELWKNFPK
jgi:acyl-CoA thioester hydrolase